MIFQPGCVEDMRSRGLEQRVCDGTVDCPDFSGERGGDHDHDHDCEDDDDDRGDSDVDDHDHAARRK